MRTRLGRGLSAELTTPSPVTGVRLSLWRAVTLFRVAALVVACFLIVLWWQEHLYARPGAALATAAAMVVATLVVGWLAVRGRAHHLAIAAADVVVTGGLTLVTIAAQTPAQQHGGMVTLTTIWAAGPTIEVAFLAGPVGGLLAAALQFAVTVVVAGDWHGRTLYSGVLLVLTGAVVGFVARLAVRAEDDLRAASAAQAALAERERLARSIHDGVLQVLALVHRTGAEAGGPWTDLAAEAGVQEAALRGLITSRSVDPATDAAPGERDLAELLRSLRSARVTVSTPAGPVSLPQTRAATAGDAVRAALQNVVMHAGDGAHAWVLLEELDDPTDAGALRIVVRDDGRGMPADRLARAETDGRIGVARSIRGRVDELGGTCTITSTPGAGTEVEIMLPGGRGRT